MVNDSDAETSSSDDESISTNINSAKKGALLSIQQYSQGDLTGHESETSKPLRLARLLGMVSVALSDENADMGQSMSNVSMDYSRLSELSDFDSGIIKNLLQDQPLTQNTSAS